jgi:uncharacterized protein with FMN-binding domain
MKGTLMSRRHDTRMSHLVRTVKKFSVSTFVVFTFIAYAVHERLNSSQGLTSADPRTPATALQHAPALVPATPTAAPGGLAAPQTPTDAPSATALPSTVPAVAAQSQYKDGQYTGPEVDAFYGLVQVQAKIQQAKIIDVQFLEYPRITERFFRVDRAHTRNIPGVGLGLALVAAVVRQYNGALRIASTGIRDQGTQAYLELTVPAADPLPEAASTAAPTLPATIRPAR